jgi:acyl carrier protein
MFLAESTPRKRPPPTAEVLRRLCRRLPDLMARAEPETRVDDLGMDSLDAVELLCAVEDEFSVQLSEEELSDARRVGDFAERIAARCAARKEAS